MAALLALYGPHPGLPFTAAPELTKTILPPILLLRKAGKAACMAVTKEKKFTSKWLFHWLRDVSVEPMRQRGSSVPAFKTRPSMCLKVSWTRDMANDKADSFTLERALSVDEIGVNGNHRIPTRHIRWSEASCIWLLVPKALEFSIGRKQQL